MELKAAQYLYSCTRLIIYLCGTKAAQYCLFSRYVLTTEPRAWVGEPDPKRFGSKRNIIKQDPHQRAEQPKTSISCSARMSRTIILLTEMIVLNGQRSVSVRDKQPEQLAEHERNKDALGEIFLLATSL